MLKFGEKPPVAVARNGNVVLNVKSVKQAKLGLQELKVEKQAYALAMRQVATKMTAIRAEYSHDIANVGLLIYRGDQADRHICEGLAALRDDILRQKCRQLGRLEMQRLFLEDVLVNIDKAIVRLEQFVAQRANR